MNPAGKCRRGGVTESRTQEVYIPPLLQFDRKKKNRKGIKGGQLDEGKKVKPPNSVYGKPSAAHQCDEKRHSTGLTLRLQEEGKGKGNVKGLTERKQG